MASFYSTCIVLGAGASLSHALHWHAQRETFRNPPLDTNFFERASLLERKGELSIPDVLKRYASQVLGRDPFVSGSASVRMEEFFQEVYFDLIDNPEREGARRNYRRTVDLYADVLRLTTGWMCEDSKSGGPLGRIIAELHGRTRQLNVLTFNHDLVVENEIHKRSRLRDCWSVEGGYGSINDDCEYTVPSDNAQSFEGSGSGAGAPIDILKMHGSLNWYIRLAGSDPSPSVLTGRRTSRNSKLFISHRRTTPGNFSYNLTRNGPGRKTWGTWPVIIPPVFGKHTLIQSYLNPVWEDAKRALGECDRLVFFGYSLPRNDLEAEKHFHRSLLANENLDRVEVIDPNPKVVERVASVATVREIRWHSCASDWLRRAA